VADGEPDCGIVGRLVGFSPHALGELPVVDEHFAAVCVRQAVARPPLDRDGAGLRQVVVELVGRGGAGRERQQQHRDEGRCR
jgi:hypothetical protein